MKNKYYLSAVSAFAIWGFLPLMLRTLQGFTSGQILYYRICFSSIILFVLVLLIRREDFRKDMTLFNTSETRQKVIALLLWMGGGLLLTVNWLTFIYTVNHISIKTASFSYLICPVLTAVLGFVLLKEKMTSLQWFAVFLCAVSCTLLGLDSISDLGYSLLTAITYGLYLIIQRLNGNYSRLTVLFVQIVFSFFLLNLGFNQLMTEVPTGGTFYITTIIIAAVFTVLPLFLNLYALIGISSPTVAILMYINPIFNFTIAFLIFHEKVTTLQVIGYSIIAIALVVFNYQNFGKLRAKIAG